MTEPKPCEHKSTLIANDYQSEWCKDCGAARFRNNGMLEDWLMPRNQRKGEVQSVEEIKEIIEKSEMYLMGWSEVQAHTENSEYFEESLNITATAIHAFLKERFK